MNNALKYKRWFGASGPYANLDTSYQCVLTRALELTALGFTGYDIPSASQRAKDSAFVTGLKADGVWDRLDVLYRFKTDGGSKFSLLNWKNVMLSEAVPVNSPTFTSNVGWTQNGTTSYIACQVFPLDFVNYTLNSASIFIDEGVDLAAANTYAFGLSDGTNQTVLLPKNGSSQIRHQMHAAGTLANTAPASSAAFYLHNRPTSGTITGYYNNILVLSNSNSTVTLPAVIPFIGALNTNGTPTGGTYRATTTGIFGMGSDLTSFRTLLYNRYVTLNS
ncbi:MAG TPA: hypothetical protein VM101_13505 [Flavitalea sp.]|nr:hypothetical protein [Flavitalea sp.]